MLVGCARQQSGSPAEALAAARADCTAHYPADAPGNAVARVRCLNGVDERLVRPRSPFPDLLELQDEYRLAYAERVDRGQMSRDEARRAQARIDAKVADIFEQRRAARRTANAASFANQAAATQALRKELDTLQSGSAQSPPAPNAAAGR